MVELDEMSSDGEEVELLTANKGILKLINVWPDENESKYTRYLKDFIVIVIIVPFSMGVAVETSREIRGLRDDISNLLQILTTFGMVFTTLMILITFRFKRGHICQIVSRLKKLESYFVPPDVQRTERIMRIFTKFWYYYTCVADVANTLMPLLQYSNCMKSRESSVHLKHVPCGLISPLWFPFDYKKSPLYELVIFYILGFTLLFSISGIGACALKTTVDLHVVGHLRTLKRQLKIAVEEEKSWSKFKKCIKYHQEIIKFQDFSNECFSIFSLILIFMASYMIGILEYQFILETVFMESLRYFLHIIVWLIIQLGLNLVAQQLWNESVSICDELYDINWMDCPIFLQQDIRFMMQRCKKPLTSETGPFGTMCNETYLSILRTAYSFYAIFSNVKSE